MKKTLVITALLFGLASQFSFAEIKKGATLQVLTNIHSDPRNHVAFTMNYQLVGGLVPACAEVTIKKVKGKVIVFDYLGQQYELRWDGYTNKAGASLMQIAETFIGPQCDAEGIAKMSKLDQDGIRSGSAQVGMSRAAVLIALGRPPIHANPDLQAPTYTYWRNKFARMLIEFDANDKVVSVK